MEILNTAVRQQLLYFGVILLVAFANHGTLRLAFADQTLSAKVRPNVLLMMADDIGYGDLSCYGSETIETPNLDQLAEDGIRLTSFYAGASVCTPSRMALLSGSYPSRLGWNGGVLGHRIKWSLGMSPQVYTMAEAFQAAGYRTAMTGKWHIGGGKLRPMHQGFDESYYIEASNNQGRDIYRGGQLVQKDFDNRRLIETFTQEAIRIINTESDAPWFLYLPFTAPHFPAEAHPDWEKRTDSPSYVKVVEELDYRIGEILAALEQRGIQENTIVIFISDNGPEGLQKKDASAGPFAGRKWSALEGGTRVPGIISYPGVIKAGQTCDAIVSAIDLFPTLTQACGIELNVPEEAQKIDGENLWNTLVDPSVEQGRSQLLYWHGWGQPRAIRSGNWKLQFGGDQLDGKADVTMDNPLLFDLDKDPGETTDISDSHPQIVDSLRQQAKATLVDVDKHRLKLDSTN